MTGFRVDPDDLIGYAIDVQRTEPFSGLAGSARHVAVPAAPAASSHAIGRFTTRLVRDLTDLSAAAGSLGRATRSAAGGYQEVDDSIASMSVA